jgi:glycosyltransferase involved in cell wall biosynthesis
VADPRPYLWSAAVATAPLQIAHGTQTKVLEAVAAGLPPVVTPCVAEGLPPEVLQACRVAAGPAAFAEEVSALLARSPAERRQLAERAELDRFSWDCCLAPLADLLQAAALSGSQR